MGRDTNKEEITMKVFFSDATGFSPMDDEDEYTEECTRQSVGHNGYGKSDDNGCPSGQNQAPKPEDYWMV